MHQRCTILLHSTTGNTRLVARLAAARLERAGHACTIHDVVKQPEPPPLDDTGLLIVACPTMYFRPTLVMERFVDRLPRARNQGATLRHGVEHARGRVRGSRPAILLATAGGMVGAHFDILAHQLRDRGWVAIAAHWVPFVNNWPPHRTLAHHIRLVRPLLRALDRRFLGLRWYLHWLWPDIGDPRPEDRDAFVRFMDRMALQWPTTDVSRAPAPHDLCRASGASKWIGQHLGQRQMRLATDVRIDPRRCTACGTCVSVCPVGCIQAGDNQARGVGEPRSGAKRSACAPPEVKGAQNGIDVPRVGRGCTGCWACFQHCPERAISGLGAPRGSGRYGGPSGDVRSLFRGERD